MKFPSYEDIRAARESIAQHLELTPVETFSVLGVDVKLKMENRQLTRSFKIRGALNAVSNNKGLTEEGFITASAGNHGLGTAQAARLFGTRATVIVYQGASRKKIELLRSLGAEVLEMGADYDEAEELGIRMAREKGLPFIHAFDDPPVIAGQGTVALELIEQHPAVRTILVPVGGGGLISGVALAAKAINPAIQVIGIQPEESAAMVRSIEQGAIVETLIGDTMCDALAGRFVSERTLEITRRFADGVVTVPEKAIAQAMNMLHGQTGQIAEPSSVVGIAALICGAVTPQEGMATIISGGNIAEDDFFALSEATG